VNVPLEKRQRWWLSPYQSLRSSQDHQEVAAVTDMAEVL
jgi:hypothetical protein